jgi:ParB family chromosome partitioning protein
MITADAKILIQEVPLAEVHYDQDFNCRGEIIPMDVVDLAKDIEVNGLLQPVLVSEYSDADKAKYRFKYLLIAGYRRFMAHKILKKLTIQASVKPTMPREDAQLLNLSENLQRKDLNILQEAHALKKLADSGITEQTAAERLGMSRGWVQIRYMLLKLPEDIQEECASGILNQTQIRDVYTHYTYRGKDAAEEAIRLIKDAKLRSGKSIRLQKKRKINPASKKPRNREEVFEMMEHLQSTIGNGLWTRTLAWSAGEISDIEMFASIKEHDDRFGDGDYVVPYVG